MNSDSFLNDLAKWDYHIEKVNQDETLTSEQKHRILQGFHYIILMFGKSWLKYAMEIKHPFIGWLISAIPGERFWPTNIGTKLWELRHVPRFNELKKKLMRPKRRLKEGECYNEKDWEEFIDTVVEVETASRLKRNGFDQELEFYPPYKSRIPDLKTKIEKENIYFETKMMGSEGYAKLVNMAQHKLYRQFSSIKGLIISCVIYVTSLSSPKIKELEHRIRDGVTRLEREGGYITISEPATIDYFIGSEERRKEFENWLKEKNVDRPGFMHYGNPLTFEVERIVRSFESENKQIPKHKPGIVIIYDDHALLSYEFTVPQFFDIASQIRRRISGHKNLLAGVLILRLHSFFKPVNETHVDRKLGYSLIRQPYDDMWQETVIIAKNLCSKYPFNESILPELFRLSRKY